MRIIPVMCDNAAANDEESADPPVVVGPSNARLHPENMDLVIPQPFDYE